MRKAVGFYWTLPVPWSSKPFIELSDNVEKAALESLTIRYQMELVRRWARNGEEKFDLVREGVFLALEPDSAGRPGRADATPPPLKQLIEFCKSEPATLLYVDFSAEIQWRSNKVMERLVDDPSVSCVRVPMTGAGFQVEGKTFDPEKHFSDWRDRHERWKAGKEVRHANALASAQKLQQSGLTQAEIAARLNENRIVTVTGKSWTAENVRKLLRVAKEYDGAV